MLLTEKMIQEYKIHLDRLYNVRFALVGYYFVDLLLNDNEYLMVYTITIDVKLLESSRETNEMKVTRCHLYQQVGAVEKVKL